MTCHITRTVSHVIQRYGLARQIKNPIAPK